MTIHTGCFPQNCPAEERPAGQKGFAEKPITRHPLQREITHPNKSLPRTKKRRGTRKARVAIARRLLTAIYHILLNDTPYQPADSSAKDSAPEQRVISFSQALALLARKGYVISDVKDISDLPLIEAAPSS